jgi:hypothetical protein
MVIPDCVCVGQDPKCRICGGTGEAPLTKEELVRMRQFAEGVLRGSKSPEALRGEFKATD